MLKYQKKVRQRLRRNCGKGKRDGEDIEKRKNIELYKAILALKNLDECCRFFEDLCTVPELRAMEQRYEVASLLNQGLIYNDILERTGASSATISRVNRSLNYGAGGYEDVFRNLAEQQTQEEKHS